ncbi:hypothetical protein ncot_11305 [Nocardioides sp. JQ2195]|nr:hypothetical protein ncot_11305 [Nocardioides sp. JQ2195]
MCSGCSNGQEDDVRDRAAGFEAALDHADWSRACQHLAPPTRAELADSGGGSCAKGLSGEELDPPGRLDTVQVFGTTAQVSFAHDTLFLSRFGDGWRVVAAGCTPRKDKPYDCSVQGG